MNILLYTPKVFKHRIRNYAVYVAARACLCAQTCNMGIHSEWPKLWAGEGPEFKVDAAPVQTVFIDGQIMLMKSKASC